MSEDLKGLEEGTPTAIIEAIRSQIKTMRDARELIDKDGVMVCDAKKNPIAHPCLAIEREAQAHLARLLKEWTARRF